MAFLISSLPTPDSLSCNGTASGGGGSTGGSAATEANHPHAHWWCRAASPARRGRDPGGLCGGAADRWSGRKAVPAGPQVQTSGGAPASQMCMHMHVQNAGSAASPLNEGVWGLGQQDAAQQQDEGGDGGQAQAQPPAVVPVLHACRGKDLRARS